MTRQEKKEELIRLFCMGAITIGDLIDECFEFGQQHPHWISVDDKLPSLFDDVLYCDKYGDYYTETETDSIGEDVEITHWIRIPDCPPLQDYNNKFKTVLDGENKEGVGQ